MTTPLPHSYHTLLSHLLTTYPPPLLPPAPHPRSTTVRSAIASLSLHPTLETALHILNADLPSAHFLVRHMQAPPAYEAMYLHGILHRIEGDYENARAWYRDVKDSEVFRWVWKGGEGGAGKWGEEAALKLIGDVERLRKGGGGGKKKGKQEMEMEEGKGKTRVEVEEELGQRSGEEIQRVLAFCEEKFGTGRVEDARNVWVGMDEESKKKSAGMIVGGEGWREF